MASPYSAFWVGVPLMIYAWTLGGPFIFDDINLLLKTEAFARGETARLDLFRFAASDEAWQAMRSRGTYPWWAPEDHRIDFVRPLSEFAFYLDVRLFGRWAMGHRLVSFLWFTLALVLIHRLFLRVSGDATRAGVATFFFGISQAVTQPVTFISNRSDLLVLVGVAVAARAYWGSMGRPRVGGIVLAAVSFAFAVLSKESGVALAGVIVAHEVVRRLFRPTTASQNGATAPEVCGTGVSPVSPPPGRRRHKRYSTVTAGVIFVMGLAYLSGYAYTRASQFDMAVAGAGPAASIAKAAQSISLYAAVWSIGFPISLLLQASAQQIQAVAVAGVVGIVVAAWYVRKTLRTDRGSPFFLLWAVMFTLPALLVHPESRALSIATVGWAYLLAGLLVPRSEDAPTRAPIWVRQGFLLTNGVVSVLCAMGTVLASNQFEADAMGRMKTYVETQPRPIQDGDTLIIAEAGSTFELICAGDRLEFLTGKKDVAVSFLTIPGADARVQRVDARTLRVTADTPALLDSPTHRLTLGPQWKAEVGHVFKLRDCAVEIADLREDGTVEALRVRFDPPLDSPELHFFPVGLLGPSDGEATNQGTTSRRSANP